MAVSFNDINLVITFGCGEVMDEEYPVAQAKTLDEARSKVAMWLANFINRKIYHDAPKLSYDEIMALSFVPDASRSPELCCWETVPSISNLTIATHLGWKGYFMKYGSYYFRVYRTF